MDNTPDDPNKIITPIEQLIAEYKRAYLRDRQLVDFGSFLTIDAIGNAKLLARENHDSEYDKFESEPILDTELGPRYFKSLANMEEELTNIGRASDCADFSRITRYVDDMVAMDFDTLKYSASYYLLESHEFRHAWFDDMLRAGLRGIKKTDCEITDLPVQYRKYFVQNTKSKEAAEFKSSLLTEFKKNSRFRKLTIAGFAGIYLLAAASGIGLTCLYDWAGNKFSSKETEWERKIDEKIDYRTDLAYIRAEQTLNNKINSFINMYAPDTEKDLPLEKRLPLVFGMLKEDAKNELVQIVVKEYMPIFEARYGPPISEEKIVQSVIVAIKSGKITLADLMQVPKEKK